MLQNGHVEIREEAAFFAFLGELLRHQIAELESRSHSGVFQSGVRGFLQAYFSVFLSMLQEVKPGEPLEPYPVTRARQLVLAYLHDSELSVTWVAKRLQLHPDYLSLLFRKTTGHPLQTYITENRLHRACELLQTTPLNTAQVAEAVGLRDASYFTRFFRQRMNTTPLEFRKATRRKVETVA